MCDWPVMLVSRLGSIHGLNCYLNSKDVPGRHSDITATCNGYQREKYLQLFKAAGKGLLPTTALVHDIPLVLM